MFYLRLMLIALTLMLILLVHADPNFFFFFNDTATTEIYTLSLHDALPISSRMETDCAISTVSAIAAAFKNNDPADRKSTRLNSSHDQISYAVFCLKKKISLSTKYIMSHVAVMEVPGRGILRVIHHIYLLNT